MAIYTCVLLDIDNTLLDFDAAERQALTDMLAEYELPHDEHACAVYHQVNRELWDALAKGQMNKQKLFQVRFGRFMQAMQLPDNGKGKAMNDRYEELLSTHADLLPGALTALEELSEVATLAIVSNGAAAVQDAGVDWPVYGEELRGRLRLVRVREQTPSRYDAVGFDAVVMTRPAR